MDRYLLNDILEERSYLEWRELMSKVNKEYHDKLYYAWKCLRCRRSDIYLWNWRGRGIYYGRKIYYHYYEHNRYECRVLGVDLPKNY